MYNVIRTDLGAFGVNLCGVAVPPPSMKLSKVRDRFSVPCASLPDGTQPAYLMPSMDADTPTGCRTFGRDKPTPALLSREHPERGIVLRSTGGFRCPPPPVVVPSASSPPALGELSSLTVVLRCDENAEEPILKDFFLKAGCDLQAEFVARVGCSHAGVRRHPDGDDEEEEGEDDDDDEEEEADEEAELATGSAQCVSAHSRCTLAMLLDPSCNQECANEACFWDNGACYRATMGCAGCVPAWLGDGECDDECFTEECSWDHGDCLDSDGNFLTPSRPRCDDNCPASWLGDGECDPACNLQQCAYDHGDCTPGSCLLALPTLAMSTGGGSSLAAMSEFSMGAGGASGGAALGGGAGDTSGYGVGPPAQAAPGTLWYDLGSFGVQSLALPPGSISLPDRGGGVVDAVHLSLALCEPLSIASAVVNVPECASMASVFEAKLADAAARADEEDDGEDEEGDEGDDDDDEPCQEEGPCPEDIESRTRRAEERRAAKQASRREQRRLQKRRVASSGAYGTPWQPVGVLATTRNGKCILASLGSASTMDKQLIDPAMPTQGVQLEFTEGSDCDEPDDFAGDGQ